MLKIALWISRAIASGMNSQVVREWSHPSSTKQVDWEDFDTVRNRISTEWRQTPPKADVICEELAKKLEIQLKKFKGQL